MICRSPCRIRFGARCQRAKTMIASVCSRDTSIEASVKLSESRKTIVIVSEYTVFAESRQMTWLSDVGAMTHTIL